MLSKNEVKYIQTLGHKKSRDEEGVFIAEGPKLVQELIESDFEIVKVYALPGWIEREEYAGEVTEVSLSDLERLSYLTTPNNVLAIAKQKLPEHDPVVAGQLTIVLDEIQDPGNMGTIIRIADWFGIKQIVASPDSADFYNSKVVQSTMGSICRVDVWYKDVLDWLVSNTIPVYGALLSGESIYKIEKIQEGILVIGNESKGISDKILPLVSHPVTIPKTGGAESLNAAVATGIILSHLL